MRILYLTHRLPYAPNRGDRIRAYHMLRRLSSSHQIDLFSLVHDDDEESRVGDVRQLVDSVVTARVARLRGLAASAGALLTGRPLTHALLGAPGVAEQLQRMVAGARPDVVLAYCSGMARLALEPPLQGIPFVLDMVDVDSQKWAALGRQGTTPRHWVYRREASLLRRFERTAVAAARATLVVNHRERVSLSAIAPAARIEVVQNGIDLDELRSPLAATEAPRVVFCGVMNYEPNEAAALWFGRTVWPRLHAARPDATFTIVGAHPTRAIRELARRDSSIHVTGSVHDVRPFLWQSAVSVAPLFVARGLQNKVLEAAAAGLPSVVTSAVVNGLPAEVLPACTVADTADVFASRVLQLLATPAAERRAMAGRAELAPLCWTRRLASLDFILKAAARNQRTERVA